MRSQSHLASKCIQKCFWYLQIARGQFDLFFLAQNIIEQACITNELEDRDNQQHGPFPAIMTIFYGKSQTVFFLTSVLSFCVYLYQMFLDDIHLFMSIFSSLSYFLIDGSHGFDHLQLLAPHLFSVMCAFLYPQAAEGLQ